MESVCLSLSLSLSLPLSLSVSVCPCLSVCLSVQCHVTRYHLPDDYKRANQAMFVFLPPKATSKLLDFCMVVGSPGGFRKLREACRRKTETDRQRDRERDRQRHIYIYIYMHIYIYIYVYIERERERSPASFVYIRPHGAKSIRGITKTPKNLTGHMIRNCMFWCYAQPQIVVNN